jgi:hypothetical protein
VELVDNKSIARGMVRVQSGEDLMDVLRALAQAADWVEAMVTGAGVLDMVELRGAGPTETFEEAEIVSLSGRVIRRSEGVSIQLRGMLLVGGEPKAGRIEGAMTGGLTLVVDAVVAPSATRNAAARHVARTPARAASSPGGSSPGASSPGRGSTPSLTGAASLPKKPLSPPKAVRGFDDDDEDEDEDNPIVDNGDVLIHPQLGRLLVVGDDSSGATKVRIDTGKIRVLRLEALQILPDFEEEEDGTRVFKIAGPRRQRSRF